MTNYKEQVQQLANLTNNLMEAQAAYWISKHTGNRRKIEEASQRIDEYFKEKGIVPTKPITKQNKLF